MKIALISSSVFPVPPKSYGGLERVVYDLGKALVKLGHKVTLFAPEGSRLEGGEVIETGPPQKSVNENWAVREENAYNIYRDSLGDFDVVHGHTWFGWEYMAKLRHPELRVLHTHHGGMTWGIRPPLEHMNLVAISKFMALEYYKKLGVDVEVVYNGVDLDNYPYSKDKGERLLYVGRFTSYKGPHIAIAVAKKLGEPLDLVGGTFVEDKEYLKSLQKECDGKQIRMFEDAPHRKKVELMRKAKALLFPSLMGEPFGLVAVEALACGTPVIAINDGAIPEIISDRAGFLCYSLDEMCKAVKKVEEIRPRDCRKQAEKFSNEIMTDNYLKLYHLLLKGEEW